jgi:hypothetical protein
LDRLAKADPTARDYTGGVGFFADYHSVSAVIKPHACDELVSRCRDRAYQYQLEQFSFDDDTTRCSWAWSCCHVARDYER